MTKGRLLKRVNAMVSTMFVLPALAATMYWHPSLLVWLLSLPLAIVWANWFEYVYHRWADHTPGSYFEKKHRLHHGQPKNEAYHNLGDNPLTTIGMFVVNWLPVLGVDLWLKIGFSGPVLFAFVAYVLLMEEVHWRMHTGEWVPESWRQYHLAHHGMGEKPTGGRTKYNIFLPIFDWLFGTIR
jgi:sterol desaturase/sphingolipid hydroxylase (fatty acid hydroxylase superfamily)